MTDADGSILVWPHTGAILAGGGSVRMGRAKQAVRLPDGRMMIEAVRDVLGDVCRQIVVVGEIAELPDLPHVLDLRPGLGPMGGIEALLASGIDSQYLVCPCDVPLVDGSLLRRLLQRTETPATVFHIAGEETILPLPARLHASTLSTVEELLDSERRGVWRLMVGLEADEVEISAAEAACLANINSPGDLDALR